MDFGAVNSLYSVRFVGELYIILVLQETLEVILQMRNLRPSQLKPLNTAVKESP